MCVTDATDKNHKHDDFYMLISNFRREGKISKIKTKIVLKVENVICFFEEEGKRKKRLWRGDVEGVSVYTWI